MNSNFSKNVSTAALSILLVVIINCCATIKPRILAKSIESLHFVQKINLTDKGILQFDSMQQVMIDKLIKENPEAAANANAFPPGFLASFFSSANSENLILYTGDTLWATLHSGNVTHYRYDTTEQKKYVHGNRKDKPVNIVDYNDFDSSSMLSYQEYPDIKKMISGFDCYKVQFSIQEDSRTPFKLGDDIIEMYVTDEINLPMAMVSPFQIPGKNYFPLHIARWSACCPGATETTILNKIVYQK